MEILLERLTDQFWVFLIVLVRISGIWTTAPFFSHLTIPVNIRVLIVISLAILTTSTLPRSPVSRLAPLDLNQNGLLEEEEVPDVLKPQYERWVSIQGEDSVRISDIVSRFRPPPTLIDLAWVLAGEFGIGLVLGLGTSIVISSVQLAGQMIDQQTGVNLGEVLNPDLDPSGSRTGELLTMSSLAAFVILNGHLILLETLSDTFRTLPPGEGFVSVPTIELVSLLVHHSLILALQIAAPILAILSLTELALGFLGHTVPQVNVLFLGIPLRIVIALLVLWLTFAQGIELISQGFVHAVESLRGLIVGWSPDG